MKKEADKPLFLQNVLLLVGVMIIPTSVATITDGSVNILAATVTGRAFMVWSVSNTTSCLVLVLTEFVVESFSTFGAMP